MDTIGQFDVFFTCVGVGVIGGVLYEPFVMLRLLFRCEKGKNKILGFVLDILFFLCFSACAIAIAYRNKFPEIRFYMWIGYGIGGIIYLKTLRRMVAFLEKVCYNKATKLVKKIQSKKKLSKTGDKI